MFVLTGPNPLSKVGLVVLCVGAATIALAGTGWRVVRGAFVPITPTKARTHLWLGTLQLILAAGALATGLSGDDATAIAALCAPIAAGGVSDLADGLCSPRVTA